MPPMPRLPRPPRHRGGQVPQSAGSVSTRSPASAASGLPGRKAIVIFGYDYDGWTMDPAIEAFETLASERVVLGDRHESGLRRPPGTPGPPTRAKVRLGGHEQDRDRGVRAFTETSTRSDQTRRPLAAIDPGVVRFMTVTSGAPRAQVRVVNVPDQSDFQADSSAGSIPSPAPRLESARLACLSRSALPHEDA